MFLSVITKNLNWEIFTKSLVTIKWWDEFRMKNFDIMGADWKIQFLGNVHQKPIYRGELPKKGSLDREGGLGEKEGDVFEGGVILQCTLWIPLPELHLLISYLIEVSFFLCMLN